MVSFGHNQDTRFSSSPYDDIYKRDLGRYYTLYFDYASSSSVRTPLQSCRVETDKANESESVKWAPGHADRL